MITGWWIQVIMRRIPTRDVDTQTNAIGQVKNKKWELALLIQKMKYYGECEAKSGETLPELIILAAC